MSKSTSRENCVQGLEHGNSHRQREIYDLLQERGPLTAKEVANETGIQRTGAKSVISKLRRDGHVYARPDLELPSRNIYEVSKGE